MSGDGAVFGNSLGEAKLKPVFEKATQLGLNLWDTAVVYSMGASESILGAFAKTLPRDEIILSTKFTPQAAGKSADPVAEMFDGGLQRLGTNYTDYYWIHNPFDVEKWTPFIIPLAKTGKFKRFGVSNHNLAQIKRATAILAEGDVEISAVQNHFSLLYRSAEYAGILDWCKQKDIPFFAYMVLEQGALSRKYDSQHPLPEGSERAGRYNSSLGKIAGLVAAIRDVGEKHGAAIPQIAIAYVIAKGAVPIVGVTKSNHVEDAAKAAEIVLAAEEVNMLESVAAETGVDTKGWWENPMA